MKSAGKRTRFRRTAWLSAFGATPWSAARAKVSSALQAAICKGQELFAQLIRELKDMPDRAVLRLVREVRDGRW